MAKCPQSGGFQIALGAVRRNAVPMVVLWAVAVAAVAAYYAFPTVAAALEPLSRWQTESGWLAAFANRVVFCGLLPGAFLLAVRSIRPPRVALVIFAYCLWGGLWGVACDLFFTLQTALFGAGCDFLTLAKKTLVDQFVWNMFVCTPANAAFFPWVESGFTRPGSVRSGFLPMLLANWIVWMPVMAAVYAFPLPLQIQLVGLASALWMLVALKTNVKGDMR